MEIKIPDKLFNNAGDTSKQLALYCLMKSFDLKKIRVINRREFLIWCSSFLHLSSRRLTKILRKGKDTYWKLGTKRITYYTSYDIMRTLEIEEENYRFIKITKRDIFNLYFKKQFIDPVNTTLKVIFKIGKKHHDNNYQWIDKPWRSNSLDVYLFNRKVGKVVNGKIKYRKELILEIEDQLAIQRIRDGKTETLSVGTKLVPATINSKPKNKLI